jgi:menaquinone-dependent protoporphyrinogen oxidase
MERSMKPILVLYGTTEGHSRKIAEFIAERCRAAGKSVNVVDSATPEADQIPPIFAGAIIIGSVHHERHQSSLTHFVKSNLAWLSVIPTAFCSVNLAMLHKDEGLRAEASKSADAFLEETGLKPYSVKLVAGALKYTQYDFFKRALLRYLVNPGGFDAKTSPDAEYTDWDDLGRFIDEYISETQGEGR